MSDDLNDSLAHYDVPHILGHVSSAKRKRWIDLIFLKQYLCHLKNANQSYDILTMGEGDTRFIIDAFLSIYHIQKEQEEWVSSGMIYSYTSSKNLPDPDPEIQSIRLAIEKQLAYIKSGKPWR